MEVSDLEPGMLDEQIEPENQMFLVIADQLVECLPHQIVWLPYNHPINRRRGLFS